MYYNPEQIIFCDQDETNDIYFVIKGELEIYLKDKLKTNILHKF